MQSTVTFSQAKAQVAAHVRESLAALPGGAGLHPLVVDNAVPCSDSDGAPPSTPVSISSDYGVTGLNASGNSGYLGSFVAHWQNKGWRVRRDDRPGSNDVVLQNEAGFQVEISTTPDGARLSIGSSSPCVAPESTP